MLKYKINLFLILIITFFVGCSANKQITQNKSANTNTKTNTKNIKSTELATKHNPLFVGLYCNTYKEEIEDSGMTFKDCISLNADGTGYFDFQDTIPITWEYNTITNNGEKLNFTFSNNNLILDYDNESRVFQPIK